MSRHRTFCTAFGYPGISTSSSTPSENSRPEPFQPTGRAPISATVDPNTIFGQNELEAVASFNDIINLARLRDEILNTAIFVHQTPDSVAALLHTTVRNTTQGHFSPSLPPHKCPWPTSATASATPPTTTPSR